MLHLLIEKITGLQNIGHYNVYRSLEVMDKYKYLEIGHDNFIGAMSVRSNVPSGLRYVTELSTPWYSLKYAALVIAFISTKLSVVTYVIPNCYQNLKTRHPMSYKTANCPTKINQFPLNNWPCRWG